jgi:hypothetical protein
MLCQKEARAVSYEIKGTEAKHRLNETSQLTLILVLSANTSPRVFWLAVDGG